MGKRGKNNDRTHTLQQTTTVPSFNVLVKECMILEKNLQVCGAFVANADKKRPHPHKQKTTKTCMTTASSPQYVP